MSSKDMSKSLTLHVAPELRARGFKGTMPHFRRVKNGAIDILSVQFLRWGGRFAIELACCPSEGYRALNGDLYAPNFVTAFDVALCRQRLCAEPSQDLWFDYDREQYDECARQVVELLDTAELWWTIARSGAKPPFTGFPSAYGSKV